MTGVHTAFLILALPALSAADEPAVTVGGLIDLRYARTDSERSWLDGGHGKLRYGASVDGPADLVRLAQVSLLLDAELSPVLTTHVQLNVDAEPDGAGLRSRANLIEAFVLYRPEPAERVRLRFRGGAFFPPISLENDGPAWTSPYTITGSAANSWVGEELRTVGAEGTFALRWPRDEVRVTGAAYGSNDPAGTLLGWRGWAIHDRQTGFGDRLAYVPVPAMAPGLPFARNPPQVDPMVEIDGRVGWYAAAAVRRTGLFEARALHYDNRGKQTTFDGRQYAWMTRFSAFGLRVELPGKAHLLGQHMQGTTYMGRTPEGQSAVVVPFRTTYGLLSVPVRRHRVSLRYERFRTEDEDVMPLLDPNDESGSAWTACYAFEATERHRLAVEVIRVESDRSVQPALGAPRHIEETLLQASWRISF
jgi:hypothetical protein